MLDGGDMIVGLYQLLEPEEIEIVEHGGATNTFDAFWDNHLIKPVTK